MAQSRDFARPAALMALGAATLGLTAVVVSARARQAERDNPPTGRIIDVDGLQVHYAEVGDGEPLVLLHGNGSMLQDFMSSGFVQAAAKRYRVIAFDRPGYGYSDPAAPSGHPPPRQIYFARRCSKLGSRTPSCWATPGVPLSPSPSRSTTRTWSGALS
jgi:hypothetical protein